MISFTRIFYITTGHFKIINRKQKVSDIRFLPAQQIWLSKNPGAIRKRLIQFQQHKTDAGDILSLAIYAGKNHTIQAIAAAVFQTAVANRRLAAEC